MTRWTMMQRSACDCAAISAAISPSHGATPRPSFQRGNGVIAKWAGQIENKKLRGSRWSWQRCCWVVKKNMCVSPFQSSFAARFTAVHQPRQHSPPIPLDHRSTIPIRRDVADSMPMRQDLVAMQRKVMWRLRRSCDQRLY